MSVVLCVLCVQTISSLISQASRRPAKIRHRSTALELRIISYPVVCEKNRDRGEGSEAGTDFPDMRGYGMMGMQGEEEKGRVRLSALLDCACHQVTKRKI